VPRTGADQGEVDRRLVDYLDDPAVSLCPAYVSQQAIADGLGISRATTYRYFGTRDDMFVRMIAESARRQADTLQAALASAPTTRTRIECSFVYSVALRQSLIIRATQLNVPSDNEAAIRVAIDTLRETMNPIYAAAQQCGSLRADLDTDAIGDWLGEQHRSILLNGQNTADRSQWVRCFIWPAIAPARAESSGQATFKGSLRELEIELAAAADIVRDAQRRSSAVDAARS
jgi:AcrR family transcriptional regulator